MAKRVSTRMIKKHRHYTYDEAADALGVSVQTVRSWRDGGLAVMTGRRPHYILGEALIEFHATRHQSRSVNMTVDQFYCLTCHTPRKPLGMMVDYIPITDRRGRLSTLCEVCGGPCQRFASRSSLKDLGQIFDIAISKGQQA